MERSALTISLQVPDVAEAVRFYTDQLGFRETGVWCEDDQPFWAEVTRDGLKGAARIWFFTGPDPACGKPAFSGLIYLFVNDVDAEAKRLQGHLPFLWGPVDQVYGLRELGVEDLNGYRICFAHELTNESLSLM